MTEYDDGSGTGMIPLDQVDSDAQMRDAQSMVHIPQQKRATNASKPTQQMQRTQTNYGAQQPQQTQEYGGMQGIPQHGSTFSAQSYHHGGVEMDYEAQSPQLYDLSGGGQATQQPAFYAPEDQHSQSYNMDDAEMKPLF